MTGSAFGGGSSGCGGGYLSDSYAPAPGCRARDKAMAEPVPSGLGRGVKWTTGGLSQMAETDERVRLTWEEVLPRLEITPDYDPGGDEGPGDCVHTFLDGGGLLLGANWHISDVEAAVKDWGCELAGPGATRMRHGLVILRGDQPAVFLATKAVEP